VERPLISADLGGMEYRPLLSAPSCRLLDFDGIWTLRFGRFGCLQSDMRGGVVHVQGGRLIGGDSNFVYLGVAEADETELTGWLEIRRHRDDPNIACLWGSSEAIYRLGLVAELVSANQIGGRLTRVGFPDKHLSMSRLLTTPAQCDWA